MTDTERITLRMPKPVHDWLRRQSFETRKSINALIVQALENKIAQEAKEDKMTTKIEQNGKNEVTKKIWKNDDNGWTGYRLEEAIGEDGRTYPTVNGENHYHFETETEARNWLS